jgi:hypothetical protein
MVSIELKSINAIMSAEDDEPIFYVNGVNAEEIDFIALGISNEDALLIWNTFKYDVLADNDHN